MYIRGVFIFTTLLLGLISCNAEKDFSKLPHVAYLVKANNEESIEVLKNRLKSIDDLEFQLVKSKSTDRISLKIYSYFPSQLIKKLFLKNGRLIMVFPNDEIIEISDADTIKETYGMDGVQIGILLSENNAKTLEVLSSKYINQKVSFQFNDKEVFAPVINDTLSKTVVINGNEDFSTQIILAVMQYPLQSFSDIKVDSVRLKLLNNSEPNNNLVLLHDSLRQKHLMLRDSLKSVLGDVEPRYDQYYDLMEILIMVQEKPFTDLCMKYKLDLQTLQFFQYNLGIKLSEVRRANEIQEAIMEINELLNPSNNH